MPEYIYYFLINFLKYGGLKSAPHSLFPLNIISNTEFTHTAGVPVEIMSHRSSVIILEMNSIRYATIKN